MSILVGLHHATHYTYSRPISLGPQIVRLRPAPHCRTRIPSYSLDVTPAEHFVNWQQDPHGNWLARFVFPEKTTEFSITVDLLADMEVINPFDFFVEPYAEKWPFKFADDLREDLASFVDPEPAGPRLKELVQSISREPRNTVDFLVELNQRLAHMIRYIVRMEPGVQTPEETLAAGAGSCRDTAWLLVQILRHIGLPSRFVSGYLIQLRPDIKSARRPRRHRCSTSPICMPGPKSICPAPAGSGWTPRRDCCAARATFRSPRRRITVPRRRSPAWSSRRRSRSPTT